MTTRMTNLISLLGVGILVCSLVADGVPEAKKAPQPPAAKSAPTETRDVDLAICLDTSGSMDGLIESAKQKLWTIVNELATAKPRPNLRVALYQYGNDGLSSENGWVQRLCPLTDNLDEVYDKLFKLRTNGGTELVARVVRAATIELKWSERKNALKMIVVAGNEPATQDSKYTLRDVCQKTIGRGIIINTIFCGNENEGRSTGWSDAAAWADGQYAAIDQNQGTVAVATPYDKKLVKLNEELNKTYVAFGTEGKMGRELQVAQDANAAKTSAPAVAERVAAKSTGLYRNSRWDLVDAVDDKSVDLEKVKTEELPENMKNMSVAERKKFVEEQRQKRADIQKQIREMNDKRLAYQKEEMKKKGLDDSKSFDANLRRAIRTQGETKGLVFESR
ncbi:MAG: VWA domain-containing protein [Phycisphaerae bacterium]|nr:VWA domain-containing protein [Phycisphaerae bacterium]